MKLTETAPPVCSSCFQQKPDARHVDFDAAWDGPVVDEGTEHEHRIKVSIDELILCEQCLAQAGKLVDLGDVGAAAAHASELEDRNRELAERLAGALNHIARLEQAVASRDALAERLAPAGRQQRPRQRQRREPAERAAA